MQNRVSFKCRVAQVDKSSSFFAWEEGDVQLILNIDSWVFVHMSCLWHFHLVKINLKSIKLCHLNFLITCVSQFNGQQMHTAYCLFIPWFWIMGHALQMCLKGRVEYNCIASLVLYPAIIIASLHYIMIFFLAILHQGPLQNHFLPVSGELLFIHCTYMWLLNVLLSLRIIWHELLTLLHRHTLYIPDCTHHFLPNS